jgi:hypothetical protein
MRKLNRLGGDTFAGQGGRRGLVFRIPREAAFRLIGAETEQPVEVSITYALATLDALLRLEDLAVVCSLPKFYWEVPKAQRARALDRVDQARTALVDYCAQHHIPAYDLFDELARAGRPSGFAPDRIHYDRPTSRFEAELIASHVLAALDLKGGPPR